MSGVVLLTTSPPSLSLRHPTPTAQAHSSTFASPTLPRPTRNGRRRPQRSSLSRRTMDARSARISETPTATSSRSANRPAFSPDRVEHSTPQPAFDLALLSSRNSIRSSSCVEVWCQIASREGSFHAQFAAAHRRLVVALQKASTTKPCGGVDQRPPGFGLFMQRHTGHAPRQLLQAPVDFAFKKAFDAGANVPGRFVRQDGEVEVECVGKV